MNKIQHQQKSHNEPNANCQIERVSGDMIIERGYIVLHNLLQTPNEKGLQPIQDTVLSY